MKNWHLAIIFGTVYALSFLGIGLGFLSFFAFIPYFMLIKHSNSKQCFYAGALFGFVLSLITLYPIIYVRIYAFIGLWVGMALYMGLLTFFLKKVEIKFQKTFYFLFPFIWIAFEYFMTLGQLNFPWFNIGYSLVDYYYLIQFADILGVYGLSFLIITINILIYNLFSTKLKTLIWIILIVVLWVGYGIYKDKTINLQTRNLKIGMIQLNIIQEDKWEPEKLKPTVNEYINQISNLAAKKKVDLVILPESAITVNLLHNQKYKNIISNAAKSNNVNIVTGFPDYEVEIIEHSPRYKYYNSACLIDTLGKYHKKYNKIKLVPFGERIPLLRKFPILKKIQFGQANFEYGKDYILYQIKDIKFSILICFEGVFPGLTRKYAANGADFLIVITNDAWFKKTVFPVEHANNTKLRAVETRLPLFRDANTGISYIITPKGNVIRKTELFKKENIVSYLYCKPETTERTFFVKIGYIFPAICFWFSLILIIYSLITTAIIFRKFGYKR